MHALLTFKFFALLEILLSLLTFIFFTVNKEPSGIIATEIALNAALGCIAGAMLLGGNKKGVVLSKIWALLQIPYIVITGKTGVVFAIVFVQSLHFKITFTNYLNPLIDANFGSYQLGINITGISLLILITIIASKQKKT